MKKEKVIWGKVQAAGFSHESGFASTVEAENIPASVWWEQRCGFFHNVESMLPSEIYDGDEFVIQMIDGKCVVYRSNRKLGISMKEI